MSTDLKYFAEKVSRDFVINKVPMNASISKIASDNSLNKHQVDRIVEQANQLTYLALFNSGQDKYASVNFELADSKAILDGLKTIPSEKKAVYLEDYKITKDIDIRVFPVIKEAKDCNKKSSNWKKRNELQKKAEFLRARGGENRVKFQRALDKFANEARISVLLNKVAFEDLNTVFPSDFVEKVATYYNIPGHTKTASDMSDGILNDKHPLVLAYNELSKLEDEYIELHKEARLLYKEAIDAAEEASTLNGAKHLISGIASDIAKAWNVIKEIPAKHLIGYPAAFLLGVMYQKSKEQDVTLSGSDVPLIFRAY